MKRINSKELVQAALHHQKTERVPLALWGSYYTLNDKSYFQFLEHTKLGGPVKPFRRYLPRNSNYYDDRVLDFLGTDCRYVWSGFTDLGGARMDSTCRDAWGVQWKRIGSTITSVESPLKDASAEQINTYPWPDPEKYFDFELMDERLTFLKREYPDKAIVGRAVNSYGPFEQACEVRGREQFYIDLLTEPEIAELLIEKCTKVIVCSNEIYLDKVAGFLDFFELPGDDYAGTEDLLISPELFDRFLKPALARIVRSVKQAYPELRVAFHSDGAITKIIGSLVETGIDILNPLEPLEATDWKTIKKTFGDRLCFMGGVDIKKALLGDKKDVETDVRRCIETFSQNGGYILTTSNHIQPDIPPRNLITLFETVRNI